jgi:hypothetical protein
VNYQSKTTLLGLPLLHVSTGELVEGRYRRGVAKGWIAIGEAATAPSLARGPRLDSRMESRAMQQGRCGYGFDPIGDISFGMVLSLGGIAMGGVAIGGLAVGGVAFGGMAVAALAFAGSAFGIVAPGGSAIAWLGALGGLAIAREYALGGLAIARHANDDVAREFFETGLAAQAKAFMDHGEAATAPSLARSPRLDPIGDWLLVLIVVAAVIVVSAQHRREQGGGRRR